MKTMQLDEFKDAIKAQSVATLDFAFICPMCGTVQSPKDLIAAGAGKDFSEVEKYIAFACVGRWTDGPSGGTNKKLEPGRGCDWTLGGFFKLHKLEVVTPDGEKHPRFEPATPEQAQAHAKQHGNEEMKK